MGAKLGKHKRILVHFWEEIGFATNLFKIRGKKSDDVILKVLYALHISELKEKKIIQA